MNYRYEYKFIGEIVKYISNKINRISLHVANYPVGLRSRVQQVKLLLDEGSNDGVNMVGIFGTVGMGKSTLARAIYNFVADQFEGLCFLHNVRENSSQNNLKHLQEELLLKTIGLKIKVGDVSEGIQIIKERLHTKKVLLILDDVNKLEQLHAMAGELDWFGRGSRVIVTTRDEHLLKCHDIERRYEIECLNGKEALDLLRWMGFKSNKVHSSYEPILNRAISYTSGLPLAIEILGSNLFGKGIEAWKYTLDGYTKSPNKEIQKLLKVSFDALEEEEQSVFLDIACFFKGCELREVEEILHAHYGCSIKHRIKVLVEKSLIKITHFDFRNNVTLHDLIEDMGKEIVRQESPKKPEKRSRLWFQEDIFEVLQKNKESSKIEMISLDCDSIKEVLDWNKKSFEKMKSLKTLIIKSGNFFINFPNSLRVLKWEYSHSTCILSSFVDKTFWNMKILELDNCEYLTQISDVSCLPNLEELSFQHCENLTTIHNSIGFLNKLEFLYANDCVKLRSFPPLMLSSLKKLQINGCKSLHSFPEILDKMENIETISIDGTSIDGFPTSFQNLIGLVYVCIEGNGIFTLSSSICEISNLLTISFWGNQTLLLSQNDKLSSTVSSNVIDLDLKNSNLSDVYIPIILTWFANVKYLDLSQNNFTILPECIKECQLLRNLKLDDCKFLEEILGIPPNLKVFSALRCKSLNFSSRSMLLNQQVHEAGETRFSFPSPGNEMIPKWFNHKSRGSTSFWFRNKFPSALIFFFAKSMKHKRNENGRSYHYWLMFLKLEATLLFNDCDYKLYLPHCSSYYPDDRIQLEHTYVFDLKLQAEVDVKEYDDTREEKRKLIKSKLGEAFFKKEWIHLKIEYRNVFDKELKVPTKYGIYIFKEKNYMEDIRFTDPNRKC
ncbi:TMV resistance protein N-like [Cicer arietinum]|uniref:TMV resistance protein N-like n=1 Tax=Cicer arietinum TaxID=3827 RepID=A0A1S3DUV4_CICAR|nr:TMV resistance protein N-like [Cicer arietinum]